MTEKASVPERGLFRISLWLSVVSAIALCLMMVVTVIDVGGRYCFNKPIYGSYELIGMLLVVASTLGMAACQKDRSHITVSLVVDLLPARIRDFIACISLFLSLATFAVITWRMFILTIHFYAKGRGGVSPDLGISNGHVTLVFTIGALMFSLVLLLHLCQSLKNVLRRS